MSTTEHTFDQIAHFFYEQNAPLVKLADALEALDIVSLDAKPAALKAALSMRGILCEAGELRQQDDFEPAAPPKADFDPFVRAAKEAVDMAVKPIPAGELLGMSGLVTEALPADGMAQHLRAASIYYIPGAGYWKFPQYASERGELFVSPSRSRPVAAAMEAFASHGWPLAGLDIERITHGEASSRFCTIQSLKEKHRYLRSIGNGLFIPIGAEPTALRPVPLTKAVAEVLIDHRPPDPIFRADDVRLYKLAAVLAKHRLATVKEGWINRSGRRQRVVYMELTETGYASLKGLDRRIKSDEF